MDITSYRMTLDGKRISDNEVFLKREDVLKKCTLSRSGLYKLMAEGRFPQPHRINDRRVVWLESDVNLWRSLTIDAFEQQYGAQLRATYNGEAA